MEFFDSLIDDFSELSQAYSSRKIAYDRKKRWQENEYSKVILQRDAALELDGTGFNLITGKPVEDSVVIIGDDLSDISSKRRFARICIVQLEDKDDEQQLYNLIRKVEYIKYHFFPEGYMIRTSSRVHKEAVRVSRDAVKKGLTFEQIGNMLISKYKENPAVKGVQVFFVTDCDFVYSEVERIAEKNNSILETLNHVINSVKFDCDTCNLKAVCDEVDGMKELHFKSMRQGS